MPSITTHDGLRLAYERSGSGTPVVFVHANGFCKETWRPVIAALNGGDAVAIDQRGHGRSEIGPPPFDWWDLGRDVLGVVDGLDLERPVGVGHSSGAAALAKSEILRPGTWRAFVLIEPIVFPGPYQRQDDHPLAVGALRRRRSFADVDQTLAAYRGRGPFERWTDEALHLYAEFGFHSGRDGRRHLACAPETEAEFYRVAGAHGAWDRLDEVACPTVVVCGEESDSHPPAVAAGLLARFPSARLITVPGATHFVPMEQPGVIAEIIRGVVGAGGT